MFVNIYKNTGKRPPMGVYTDHCDFPYLMESAITLNEDAIICVDNSISPLMVLEGVGDYKTVHFHQILSLRDDAYRALIDKREPEQLFITDEDYRRLLEEKK